MRALTAWCATRCATRWRTARRRSLRDELRARHGDRRRRPLRGHVGQRHDRGLRRGGPPRGADAAGPRPRGGRDPHARPGRLRRRIEGLAAGLDVAVEPEGSV
jgi:hypothetical protein